MAEESLRRSLAQAFDPGPGFPDARLLGRTMAAIAEAGAPRGKPWRFATPPLPGRRLVALALLVALLVAAAGAFLAIQHFVATPSPVWSACGGEFQCSSVRVPLDYSNPSAASIDVAVVRRPAADGAHRIGSLLVAGPNAGVDFLRQNSAFYSDQFRRFDLVAFDERGFGRTSPVRCLSDFQIDAVNSVDTVLDDAQEKQVFLQASQAVAQACQQKAGRLLPFVDTASDARDVDAIRAALGEARITILAYGYGTYLAQIYAHLYPTHVRAMALDGVIDPTAGASLEWQLRAEGYQAELEAFLASCRSSASCALGQAGGHIVVHPDPGTTLAGLMQAIDQNPLRVGARTVGRRLAIAGLMLGLDPIMWPQLDTALSDAVRGDGAALLALADAFDGRNSDGSYQIFPDAAAAQLCVDRQVSTDIAVYDSLGTTMSAASSIFGPAFQYVPLVCASWPVKSRSTSASLPAPGAPPILVVAGTHDPYYPPAGARAVHAQLAGSIFLMRDGYGVFSYPNSGCVRLAVNAYLTQLQPPALGAVCPSDYPA